MAPCDCMIFHVRPGLPVPPSGPKHVKHAVDTHINDDRAGSSTNSNGYKSLVNLVSLNKHSHQVKFDILICSAWQPIGDSTYYL